MIMQEPDDYEDFKLVIKLIILIIAIIVFSITVFSGCTATNVTGSHMYFERPVTYSH